MKKLIKSIFLYDDGSYEEKYDNIEKPELSDIEKRVRDIFADVASSRRIQFNVAVYIMAKHLYEEGQLQAINSALTTIASLQGVTRPTVCDKTYRQLDLTSTEYKRLIEKALKGDIGDLIFILEKNSGARTKNDDLRLINKYIKEDK